MIRFGVWRMRRLARKGRRALEAANRWEVWLILLGVSFEREITTKELGEFVEVPHEGRIGG